jgi:hypothetical protein
MVSVIFLICLLNNNIGVMFTSCEWVERGMGGALVGGWSDFDRNSMANE